MRDARQQAPDADIDGDLAGLYRIGSRPEPCDRCG
jgi:hypothetical protein